MGRVRKIIWERECKGEVTERIYLEKRYLKLNIVHERYDIRRLGSVQRFRLTVTLLNERIPRDNIRYVAFMTNNSVLRYIGMHFAAQGYKWASRTETGSLSANTERNNQHLPACTLAGPHSLTSLFLHCTNTLIDFDMRYVV